MLPEMAPPTRKGQSAAFDKPACTERVLAAHDEEGTVITDTTGYRFKKTKRLTRTWWKDVWDTADNTKDKPRDCFIDLRLARKYRSKTRRAAGRRFQERKTMIEERVVKKAVGLSR